MDEKINSKDIIDLIPLDTKTSELAQEIINEENIEKVQDLTHLFNLNQAKKNVLRVMKLNSLLDKVSDQMIERFEKRPGEFSNNDLLNYMQITQNAIDRAQKQLNIVDEAPAISLNQVNINIENSDGLDRDSRAKITEAISQIFQMANKLDIMDENIQQPEEIIIEPDSNKEDEKVVETAEITDTTQTVYNNKLLNEEE